MHAPDTAMEFDEPHTHLLSCSETTQNVEKGIALSKEMAIHGGQTSILGKTESP